MAKVYPDFTATHENERPVPSRDNYSLLLRAAEADRYRQHTLVGEATAGDIILCTHLETSPLFEVRRHPLRAKYPERFFYYTNEDGPFPFAPGVYSSIRASDCNPRRTTGGSYLLVTQRHRICPPARTASPPSYLFSFVGSLRTHPLRKQLLRLRHPSFLLVDTSGHPAYRPGQTAETYEKFEAQYAEALRDSLFVLCPRGAGPSSIRIFETLKAGRVPVIISDDWVPPPGPRWSSLSLRVPESRIEAIPTLLEKSAGEGPTMARFAHEAWNTFFSQDSIFHHLVETCLHLQRSRILPERVSSRLAYLRAVRVRHWRSVALRLVRSWLVGPIYPSG